MSVRSRLFVVLDQNATPSLAEEVRELRKLAKDRRAASLVLFRNNTRNPALPGLNLPRRGRERRAA